MSYSPAPVLALMLLSLWFPAIDPQEYEAAFQDISVDDLQLETESYCYVGRGQLMPLRTCRIPWVSLEADKCRFDPRDSTLRIIGRLEDGMNHTDLSLIRFQAIVGALYEECGEIPVDSVEIVASGPKGEASFGLYDVTACLDPWQRHDVESTSEVSLRVKVLPGACLFIVPEEPEPGSSYPLVIAEILDISRLLSQSQQ